MYKIGEFVIHGSNGVCRVEGVGPLANMGAMDRQYYTLTPLYSGGGRIFSPVDNRKVIMRPILTKHEAEDLLSRVNELPNLTVMDEKKRELVYKEAYYSGRCEELVRIMKTIYMRERARTAQGKRTTASDERYMHLAEESLFGELAVSFGISKEEAKQQFLDCLRFAEDLPGGTAASY